MDKLEKLRKYISSLGKVAVAFSGGVDSTLLLKACKDTLKEKVVAFTINAPYICKNDIKDAKRIASNLGVKHIIINMSLPLDLKINTDDKCYICKKAMFTEISKECKKLNIEHILDGTNFDDFKDYKSSIKALREFYIKMPLLEIGFKKSDIRKYSKDLNLSTWDKISDDCLLNKLEIGEEISLERLQQIELSDIYIETLGIKGIRLKGEGEIAKIEINGNDRLRLFDLSTFDKLLLKLKEFGFNNVSLDIAK